MTAGAFERPPRGGYFAPGEFRAKQHIMAKAAKTTSVESEARGLLDQLEKTAGNFASATHLKGKPAAKRLLQADARVQAAAVLEAIRGVGALRAKIDGDDPCDLFNVHHVDG
jgi:hypothetical protein